MAGAKISNNCKLMNISLTVKKMPQVDLDLPASYLLTALSEIG